MKIILLIVVLSAGCGSDDKGASPGDSTPVTPQVVVVPEREQDARLYLAARRIQNQRDPQTLHCNIAHRHIAIQII